PAGEAEESIGVRPAELTPQLAGGGHGARIRDVAKAEGADEGEKARGPEADRHHPGGPENQEPGAVALRIRMETNCSVRKEPGGCDGDATGGEQARPPEGPPAHASPVLSRRSTMGRNSFIGSLCLTREQA